MTDTGGPGDLGDSSGPRVALVTSMALGTAGISTALMAPVTSVTLGTGGDINGLGDSGDRGWTLVALRPLVTLAAWVALGTSVTLGTL